MKWFCKWWWWWYEWVASTGWIGKWLQNRSAWCFFMLSCEDFDNKVDWDCVERNDEYSKGEKQMQNQKAAGLILTSFSYHFFFYTSI